MLVGLDDVHLVHDGEAGGQPAPVSAVISTRIKPGQEAAYRAWEQRIAAAQAQAPGFQGYRLEPPVPGVQDDWLAILRFDTDAHLQAWLESPERQKLLEEADPFTAEYHARIVRTGFDQWFPVAAAAPRPRRLEAEHARAAAPLSGRVPVRRLGSDALADRARDAVLFSLFIANVVSIVLLNWLVPRMGEPVRVVVGVRGRASAADRDRRVGARGRALCHDAVGVLAAVLKHRVRGRRAA